MHTEHMLHSTKLLTIGTLTTLGFLATALFGPHADVITPQEIPAPTSTPAISTSHPMSTPYTTTVTGTHITTSATASPVTYQWPAGHPVRVLKAFAPGKFNWNPGHRGVDLEMNDGAPIFPAADGVVLYAGKLNDRNVISIVHDDGIRTTYEPVMPLVVIGQHVRKGDIIGTVTGQHCIDRACLHWGAKRGKKNYLDPLSLLEGPISLLN